MTSDKPTASPLEDLFMMIGGPDMPTDERQKLLSIVEEFDRLSQEMSSNFGPTIATRDSAVERVLSGVEDRDKRVGEKLIQAILEAKEAERRRRIEQVEEEERARLRVRVQWEVSKRETEVHQEEAKSVPLTPMKRAAIIERLGRKYPALESALDRSEEWAKACRTGKRGWYYLERIEAECRARWGGTAPAPAADLSPAAQIHRIGR
ncbi:hypothetical protein ACKVEX_05645 [Rhodocyclaceae bacterium SMB388]